MIYFLSDYSIGAHPSVMKALNDTNLAQTDGYGHDSYTEECTELIRKLIGKENARVFYFVGGTPTNIITVSAMLKPYEGVITPKTGHIFVHETGSLEMHGHRVFTAPTIDGKLTPSGIEEVMLHHEDEHTVIPRAIAITHPTENGGVYTLDELKKLRECCDKNHLYMYLDGARLGTALTWPGNDVTLKDLANLCDAFYIGGTKLGALFGEALILLNDEIEPDYFRYCIKQGCGLLAKGRLIAIQMKALLEGNDPVYLQIGKRENELAIKLANGIKEKGYKLWVPHQTNQIFAILEIDKLNSLLKDFMFYDWTNYDETHHVARFVINWNTTEEEIDKLLNAL